MQDLRESYVQNQTCSASSGREMLLATLTRHPVMAEVIAAI